MKERYFVLDGVRGFAVLIVFLSHTSGRGAAVTSWLEFHGIGIIGVYLFFVLSGFLLTVNLISEKKKYGLISLKSYYIRRFFRIAPLYYLMVSAVFYRQISTGEIDLRYLYIQDGASGFIRHLLFVQGDGVFWTIPAEVTFYVLLPVIVMTLLRFGRSAVLPMSILTVLFSIWTLTVILGFVESNFSPKLIDINHLSQFIEVFLCGSIIGFLYSNDEIKTVFNKPLIIKVTTFFTLVTLILTLLLVSNNFLGLSRTWYEFRWFSLLFGIVFSLMICVSLLSDGLLNKMFKLRFLRYMGVVGFSWYLIHFEVLRLVNMFQFESYQKFCLSFIGCGILSGILYLIVEKPFIEFAKKITLPLKNNPIKTDLLSK